MMSEEFNPLDLLAAAAAIKSTDNSREDGIKEQSSNYVRPLQSDKDRRDHAVHGNDTSLESKRLRQILDKPFTSSFPQTDAVETSEPSIEKSSSQKESLSTSSTISSTIVSRTGSSKIQTVLVTSAANNLKSDKTPAKIYLNPTTGQRYHLIDTSKLVNSAKSDKSCVTASTGVNYSQSLLKAQSAGVTSVNTDTKGRNIVTIVNNVTHPLPNKIQPTSSITPKTAAIAFRHSSVPNVVFQSSTSTATSTHKNTLKAPYMMIRLPAGLSPGVKAAALQSLIPHSLLGKGVKITTVPINHDGKPFSSNQSIEKLAANVYREADSQSNVSVAKHSVDTVSSNTENVRGAIKVSTSSNNIIVVEKTTLPKADDIKTHPINVETVLPAKTQNMSNVLSTSVTSSTSKVRSFSDSALLQAGSNLEFDATASDVSASSASGAWGRTINNQPVLRTVSDGNIVQVSIKTKEKNNCDTQGNWKLDRNENNVSSKTVATLDHKTKSVAINLSSISDITNPTCNPDQLNTRKIQAATTAAFVSNVSRTAIQGTSHVQHVIFVSNSDSYCSKNSSATFSSSDRSDLLGIKIDEKATKSTVLASSVVSDCVSVAKITDKVNHCLDASKASSKSAEVKLNTGEIGHKTESDSDSIMESQIFTSAVDGSLLDKSPNKLNMKVENTSISSKQEAETESAELKTIVPVVYAESGYSPVPVDSSKIVILNDTSKLMDYKADNHSVDPMSQQSLISGFTSGTSINNVKTICSGLGIVGTSPTKGLKATVTGLGFPARLVLKTNPSETFDMSEQRTLKSVPLSQLKQGSVASVTETQGTVPQTSASGFPLGFRNFKTQFSSKQQPGVSKYVDSCGSYVKPGQKLPDIKIPAGAKITHPLRDHDYCYHVFYELAINSNLPEKRKKGKDKKRKVTAEKDSEACGTSNLPKPKKKRKSKSLITEVESEIIDIKPKVEVMVELNDSSSDLLEVDSETVTYQRKLAMSDSYGSEPDLGEPRKKRKYVRKASKVEEEFHEVSEEPVKITGSNNFQDQFVYFATKKLKSRTRDLSKKTHIEQTTWPFGSSPFGPGVPLGPYASIGGLPSRTPPHPQTISSFNGSDQSSSLQGGEVLTSNNDLNNLLSGFSDSEDENKLLNSVLENTAAKFSNGINDDVSKQSIEDIVKNMTQEQIQTVINLMSSDMSKKLADNDDAMGIDISNGTKPMFDFTSQAALTESTGKPGFEPNISDLPGVDQTDSAAMDRHHVGAIPKLSILANQVLEKHPVRQSSSNLQLNCNHVAPQTEIPSEQSVVNTVLSLESESVQNKQLASSYSIVSDSDVVTEIVSDFEDFSQINLTPMDPLTAQEISNLNTTPTGAGLFDLDDDNILNTSVASMNMLFDSEFSSSPIISKSAETVTSNVSTLVSSSPLQKYGNNMVSTMKEDSPLKLVTRDSGEQGETDLNSNGGFGATGFLDKRELFPDVGRNSAQSSVNAVDDVCAPELTTVSMYWNTFPGLLMRGKEYVRLVDIHKQALPAKDTGLLKKRCQTMALPYQNCTELQRDFLIRYAFASPSRSTIIVSKDVAQILIGSYVEPAPKTLGKKKNEPPKKQESNTKDVADVQSDSTEDRNTGSQTPENENAEQSTKAHRELFKNSEVTGGTQKQKKQKTSELRKKPLRLKLKRLHQSEDSVTYIPADRKSKSGGATNWKKAEHLRSNKHVNYKHMLLPGKKNNSCKDGESGIEPDSKDSESGDSIESKNSDMILASKKSKLDKTARRMQQKRLELELQMKIKEEESKLKQLKKKFKSGKVTDNAKQDEDSCMSSSSKHKETSSSETGLDDIQLSETAEEDRVIEIPEEEVGQVTELIEGEESILVLTEEIGNLRENKVTEADDLNVGETCEVHRVIQCDGETKDCSIEMKKLPPLEIVHRDIVHKKLKRGLSQDGDLLFHLYQTCCSQCVQCVTCTEFFTVGDFLKHAHDPDNRDIILGISVKQSLELRTEKPSEKEQKLWDLFLRKKSILESKQKEKTLKVESESRIVSSIKNEIHKMDELASNSEKTEHDNGAVTRHSARVRKRKQLYPIEKYAFAKLLPNAVPEVKALPFTPSVEFNEAKFLELERKLLPHEIPQEVAKMSISVSPVKKHCLDSDSNESNVSSSPDVVKKYDLSPRTLNAPNKRLSRRQKVVVEKNGKERKLGQYTALEADS